MAEKATKQKANYRNGTAKRHCGICSMFRKPDSCTAVEGKISPAKLCDYFERRKGRDSWYGEPHAG